MNDITTTAANGLIRSIARFNTNAERIVTAPRSEQTAGNDTIIEGIAALTAEETAFKAQCAVFKTADQMRGTLLDTVV